MMNFDKYHVLTFDCYGTLIDWEAGILAALKPVLAEHRVELSDDEILKLYAEFESQAETGRYIKYREVLRQVMREFGHRFDFVPTAVGQDPCDPATNWKESNRQEHRAPALLRFEESLPNWKPFGDTVAALRALKMKYRLGIISNVDDDLLAHSAKQLEVDFDFVITAEQVGAYKPSLKNFNAAIKRSGVPKDRILHIAQSIYHDIVPAKQLGLATVWVNRRHGQRGTGATPPAKAKPDLEVPDLKTLVSVIGL